MFEKYIIIDVEAMIADYEDNKATLENLKMQSEELADKDIGSIDYSKDRVQTSPTNDGMINAVILKTEVERKKNSYENDLALYEMAWERLTDKERYILTEFSIYPKREKQNAIDHICDKYAIDTRWAYQLRSDALTKLKTLIFG